MRDVMKSGRRVVKRARCPYAELAYKKPGQWDHGKPRSVICVLGEDNCDPCLFANRKRPFLQQSLFLRIK
jgi:hypothetical protein